MPASLRKQLSEAPHHQEASPNPLGLAPLPLLRPLLPPPGLPLCWVVQAQQPQAQQGLPTQALQEVALQVSQWQQQPPVQLLLLPVWLATAQS